MALGDASGDDTGVGVGSTAGSSIGDVSAAGAGTSRRTVADHRPQLFGVRLDEPSEVLEESLLPPEERVHRGPAGVVGRRRGTEGRPEAEPGSADPRRSRSFSATSADIASVT